MPIDTSLMNATQRLFLAIWPDDAVQRQLVAHARQWSWPPNCAQYLPRDWHVTLHFIGSVDSDQVKKITSSAAVPFQPFELVLNQPTIWPHGLAVLCAGEMPTQLGLLFDRLGQALCGLGPAVETRPYQPHVTLARRASTAIAPASAAPVVWNVRGYALVVSTGNLDDRYRIIHRYGLHSY